MRLFEFIYYLGYRINKSYSLKKQRALPSRVISIGNITTGGTGKTPAVMAVAQEALRRGLNPCILTRGYRGRLKVPCFVSRGSGALLGVTDAGDEPVLMAEKLSGVPIVKSADRYEGGIYALRELNPQAQVLFILDDGFQHWRLKRDKDILLINAVSPFGGRKLLPLGILREPLSEIKRADVIVITNSPAIAPSELNGLMAEIKRYNRDAPLFLAEHRLSGIRRVTDPLPGVIRTPADSPGLAAPDSPGLAAPVYAFCGIGEPESFRHTLISAGLRIKGFRAFRDHYAYKEKDITTIRKEAERCNAQWIITTEKDIIRLKGSQTLFHPEAQPPLVAVGIEFAADEGFYTEIFKE